MPAGFREFFLRLSEPTRLEPRIGLFFFTVICAQLAAIFWYLTRKMESLGSGIAIIADEYSIGGFARRRQGTIQLMGIRHAGPWARQSRGKSILEIEEVTGELGSSGEVKSISVHSLARSRTSSTRARIAAENFSSDNDSGRGSGVPPILVICSLSAMRTACVP